jgi:hypothetical protein
LAFYFKHRKLWTLIAALLYHLLDSMQIARVFGEKFRFVNQVNKAGRRPVGFTIFC